MKYNTAIEGQSELAWDYLSKLCSKKKVVEVIAVSPKRSLNQNSYLHLLLGLFGLELGYTIEEAKIIYKRDANRSIYAYKKNKTAFLRSSADLSVDEMRISIDRFREFAGYHGIELPAAMSQDEMISLQNRMEQNRDFL